MLLQRPASGLIAFDALPVAQVREKLEDLVALCVNQAVENLLATSEVSIRQSVTQLQFTALSMYRTAIERVTRRVAGESVESVPALDAFDPLVDPVPETFRGHDITVEVTDGGLVELDGDSFTLEAGNQTVPEHVGVFLMARGRAEKGKE